MNLLCRVQRLLLTILLFGAVCHSPAPAQHGNSAGIDNILKESRAGEAYWSVVVRDSMGSVVEGYNSDKLVRPASNLKLLTSAAIFEKLGPDFTFKTYMYGLGQQQGRVWKGDIVIRGSGDPSISGEFYDDNRFFVFDKFYDALDSLGITKIEGNLIGNTSYFDEQPYPKGWNWDDLSFYYGVEISALSFNENAVDLEVFADDEVGETPRIQWFPFDTDYVSFINEQVITPPNSEYDEFYRRILGTNTILLRSKLPQNYYEKESLSVLNAPLYFMDTFKKYLQDGDIQLGGRIIIDSQQRDWNDRQYQPLAVHESHPLDTLMYEVNKESSNFYTEMLLKTAAAEHYNTEGSTELGISLVKEFASNAGMDTSNVKMTDGSGMSPATLLGTADLTLLLVKLQEYPFFKDYIKSLPNAGLDGLLKNRFKNSPLKDRMKGKTGYVSGVRTLSGYMKASSGKPLIFSMATNNYTEKTSYIDSLHRSILEYIYSKY